MARRCPFPRYASLTHIRGRGDFRLSHYSATLHYSVTSHVTAYPNPNPNPNANLDADPNLNSKYTQNIYYTYS